MGTGICLFLGGKMGFHALGLGFISKKTIENGNGILIQKKHLKNLNLINLN